MSTNKYSDYKLVRVAGNGDCIGCEFDGHTECAMPDGIGWPITLKCGDVKNGTQLVYKKKEA